MAYPSSKVVGPNPPKGKNWKSQEWSPLPGLTEEEFIELARSILIVVPYRYTEGINTGIADHYGMWARFGTPYANVRDPHGGFIESMRAGIVRTFLDYRDEKPHIKYLVMIDNDEAIEWDAPYKLAMHDKPVVSGVVCAYSSKKGVFGCFTVKDKAGIPRFPSYQFTRAMPASGLIEAEHVGGGLVCIRHDVLDRFVKEFKDIESSESFDGCKTCAKTKTIPFAIPNETRLSGLVTGDLKKGEDIVFSEQCESYGFKRYVDLSVRASHFKTLPLSWPQEDIDPDLDPADWVVSDMDTSG